MAAAAAMIGGGFVSAYGQMYQGNAAKMAGDYNAQMAEQNAELTLQAAAADESKFRSQVKRQLGDMRASYGSSGVTMEGSPFDVLEDSVAQAEMDALSIRGQGQMKAWSLRNEAKLQRFQGETTKQGAALGGASSILTSGGHAYGYGKRV